MYIIRKQKLSLFSNLTQHVSLSMILFFLPIQLFGSSLDNRKIMWDSLPLEILAYIFSNLDHISDRLNAAYVCEHWRNGAINPMVWKNIVLKKDDHGLPKYCQEFLPLVIQYCRTFQVDLSSDPDGHFLVEIVCELCDNIQELTVTYLSKGLNKSAELLFKIIKANSCLQLIDIENIHLLHHAPNAPLPVGPTHAKTLTSLRIVNSLDQFSCSLMMYLVNLKELTITPKYLHFGIIDHLSNFNLKVLNLVNKPKSLGYLENLRNTQWIQLACKPDFKVRLFSMKNLYRDENWLQSYLQGGMPLSTLVYNNWKPLLVNPEIVHRHLCAFSSTLITVIDFSVMKESEIAHLFCECEDVRSGDTIFINFIKRFQNIQTLSLRVPISSCALLMGVTIAKHLKVLPVLEVYITFADTHLTDICHPPLSSDYLSSDSLEKAVSNQLGQIWKLLTREQYNKWMTNRYLKYFGEFLV